MGHSIALSVAWAEIPVTIYGLNNDEIDFAITGIGDKATVLLENQLLDKATFQMIQQRIHFSTDLSNATRDATIIIEAAPENLPLKQDLFQEIGRASCRERVYI